MIFFLKGGFRRDLQRPAPLELAMCLFDSHLCAPVTACSPLAVTFPTLTDCTDISTMLVYMYTVNAVLIGGWILWHSVLLVKRRTGSGMRQIATVTGNVRCGFPLATNKLLLPVLPILASRCPAISGDWCTRTSTDRRNTRSKVIFAMEM